MSVAAFKTDFDVHFAVDGKFARDGVELERTETQMDDIDTTQLLRLGDHEGGLGVEGIDGIGLRVFCQGRHGVVLGDAPHGGRDVDASHALVSCCPHLNHGLGALRDGDEAVESRQVGEALLVGRNDTFRDDGLHQFALAADGVETKIAQLKMQADVLAVGSSDGEGLAE